MLAAEVGGQRASTSRRTPSATRSAPCRSPTWSSTSAGELRQLVNVYVDGVDVREHEGMDTRLSGSEEIRLVAAIAGG